MQLDNPDLSIIIPAHNESKAIEKTLKSLTESRISCSHEIIVACNGCTDDTAQKATQYKNVKVVSSEKSGMSFGKNLGARNAKGKFYIFIDADTTLPAQGIDQILKQLTNNHYLIGTVAGKPAKGGILVKVCFLLANISTRKNKLHAPGGVMLMQRKVFEDAGGFNEELPQGTSSDLIIRARANGAKYIFINKPEATTSIRRFEKTGIIWQMLDWRKNHKKMNKGAHDDIKQKDYKVFR